MLFRSGKALVGEVEFRHPETNRKWRLELGTTTDTCMYKTQQPKGNANPMVCEQLVDEQPFLLPTHWKMPYRKGEPTPEPPDKVNSFLGELPTVAVKGEVSLRLWLPDNVQHAVLQYLDRQGSIVLQNNPIGHRGWMDAHLDLRYSDPGTYLCRLIVDGKPVGTRTLTFEK